MKEAKPGLLLEVSPDLSSTRSVRLLNEDKGFKNIDDLDFSGICHDPGRNCFWIVSHQAKNVYWYDWDTDVVVQHIELSYQEGGKHRKIKQAEGVAVSQDGRLMYIVSDAENRLYVYQLSSR